MLYSSWLHQPENIQDHTDVFLPITIKCLPSETSKFNISTDCTITLLCSSSFLERKHSLWKYFYLSRQAVDCGITNTRCWNTVKIYNVVTCCLGFE